MNEWIDPNSWDAIPVTVDGIPALARITHYFPGEAVSMGVHDRKSGALIDPGHPGADEDVEFTLHDREGNPAPWLWDKADELELMDQVLAKIHSIQNEGHHAVSEF